MSIKLKGSTDGSVTLQAPADTSPTGTDKTLILPTGVGSANQILRNGSTAGTLEFATIERVKRTYSTEVTYSSGATTIEFTGIPANFSRLRLIMRGVSLSGTDHIKVQIGHAANGGTYLTTGYDALGNSLGTSSISGIANSTSYIIRMGSANNIIDGYFELLPDLATSPTRLYSSHALMNTGGSSTRFGAGLGPDISSVTIDRIKLLASGSNTFDNNSNAALSLITEVIE